MRAAATLTIVNAKGLHARAAAKFVEVVERHDATARVARGGQSVMGDSIMGLLMLAASTGTTIDVACEGPEAALLLAALQDLVAGRFGEDA
ncbi:MAG: HPr family phosphocarrier protein [Pseudomonadota bacterium]